MLPSAPHARRNIVGPVAWLHLWGVRGLVSKPFVANLGVQSRF